ncbi:MAG: hypothetical protein SFZ23_07275 [Planctomycetota bacterium]|nr:hypothetical protein [Planctomycetota bacterium]
MKAMLGGVLGAVVGAALWTAVAAAFQIEAGLVAWFVGLAVGFGVYRFSSGKPSIGRGVMAALVAFVAVLGGKLGAATFNAEKFNDAMLYTDEMAKSKIAYGILEHKLGQSATGELTQEDMEAAQAEAARQWHGMTPGEQQAYLTTVKAEFEAIPGLAGGIGTVGAFFSSFGLFDVLWILLAVGSACKLGATGRENAGEAPSQPQAGTADEGLAMPPGLVAAGFRPGDMRAERASSSPARRSEAGANRANPGQSAVLPNRAALTPI